MSTATALQGVGDKAAHLIILDEEPVVTVWRAQNVQLISSRRQLSQFGLQAQREETIRVDTYHCQRRMDRRQRCCNPAATTSQVKQCHRLSQGNIGVRIEAPSELVRVVIKIGLHRESSAG